MAATETKSLSKLQHLSQKFDHLPIRERRLIMLVVPALLLYVGIISAIEPVLTDISKMENNIERANEQRHSLEETQAQLFVEISKDPDEQTKLNLSRMEEKLVALEEQFQKELGQLVPPQAMPVLLEQLFENAEALSLLKMESIAPKSIFTDEQSKKKLFRHGIRITFEGAYSDTRDFLANAENLGWKLYWKHLQYQVDEHPTATTQLEVFTLSTSEAFIGVN